MAATWCTPPSPGLSSAPTSLIHCYFMRILEKAVPAPKGDKQFGRGGGGNFLLGFKSTFFDWRSQDEPITLDSSSSPSRVYLFRCHWPGWEALIHKLSQSCLAPVCWLSWSGREAGPSSQRKERETMLSNSQLGGRCQGRSGARRLSRLLSRKQKNPSLLFCFEYLI